MTQDCATCRFFVAKDEGSGGHGDCRRHAPVVTPFTEFNGLGEPLHMPTTSWPQVGEAQWCGDFEDGAREPGERIEGGIRRTVYKCQECHDGQVSPKSTWPKQNQDASTCPACNELCIPF